MQKILCATRGGLASQVTQKAARELALSTSLPLIYLYVVNTEFMRHTTELSHIHDVAREMTRLGEFILLVAVERAAAEGVQAEGIVREGKWQEELLAAAVELRPAYVVLGSPSLNSLQDPEAARHIQERAQQIREACGAEVVIVLPTGERKLL
jgi:hypothetical protein